MMSSLQHASSAYRVCLRDVARILFKTMSPIVYIRAEAIPSDEWDASLHALFEAESAPIPQLYEPDGSNI